ncbi:response regulator transcription factor [Spongiivirga citrea]|uniref:Response regulator n=1 Tax=Spongiivirga citrea TaxID=1481457 RepID=A0A6M0CG77_9FLAO|nr:response regulator transcription factor [Spongiivirga citrea]NER15893.1 response regulator [Spongiivirga citrea]
MGPNIIIVDDHKMFLEGLLGILQKEKNFNILFTANTGANVVKYLEINDPKTVQLVVTDISMPEVDGIELNQLIKKKYPSVKVLVVSMHHDPVKISTLINDKVDGYVPKNAEKEELLLAINTILGGKKYFSDSIKKVYSNSIFNDESITVAPLTKREKEVLTLIAQEHTTQEIADKLFLSKHTVESYRKNLIAKLDVRNLAGLTKQAIKMGLVE